MTLTRGGLTMELFHVQGETDDATVGWLPEQRILLPGDMFIWVTPNCGNPQKVQRYPREWAIAMRRMAALGAETMLPSHGAPIFGADRIRQALTETAEWLESLVEQTLDGMNAGARLDELVHAVKPPEHLADRPYLRARYDEPEFIVRNLWRRYAGWYDGNPANLKPAPDRQLAAAVAELAGGSTAPGRRRPPLRRRRGAAPGRALRRAGRAGRRLRHHRARRPRRGLRRPGQGRGVAHGARHLHLGGGRVAQGHRRDGPEVRPLGAAAGAEAGLVGRWPARVYGEGAEPDPRFTFANERTFLAWLRTALALVVAGVAVDVLAESGDADGRRVPPARGGPHRPGHGGQRGGLHPVDGQRAGDAPARAAARAGPRDGPGRGHRGRRPRPGAPRSCSDGPLRPACRRGTRACSWSGRRWPGAGPCSPGTAPPC